MYVKMFVSECDFTERTYPTPVIGAGVVAQGATGRWCVVMLAGPEYLNEAGITPITEEEGRDLITKSGNGWPDF